VQRLEFYDDEELGRIVTRSAGILGVPIDGAGAHEIARRSRGTPRIANRLLRRVRDFAQVEGDGRIDLAVAAAAMDMLDVDPRGFDIMDRRLLLTIIEKFDGGPVGVDSLAAAIGEERGTIEDVLEPFLIQQGLMMRTARGRMATRQAYLHFGLPAPSRALDPGNAVAVRAAASRSRTEMRPEVRERFSWPVRVYYEDTDSAAWSITPITSSSSSVRAASGCARSASRKPRCWPMSDACLP
jgi:hypothetical protein